MIGLHGGVVQGSEQYLARLSQGAAVADSAISPAGLDPDDIDFDVVRPAERRRAVKLLKVFSPVAASAIHLEEAYIRAWSARRLQPVTTPRSAHTGFGR